MGSHWLGLAVAAGAIGLGLHAVLVAPRRLQVTRHTVPLRHLPDGLAGLRLVQITDVHLGPFFRAPDVRRAVLAANACEPDLVALTGDFVNFRSMEHLKGGAAELSALSARLGVFACLGNHDHWEGAEEVTRALEEAGVRVLVNESVCLEGGLWLGGVDDVMAAEADLKAVADGMPPEAPVVLLSHNATILPQVADRPWVVLSGHSHGSQLCLPFLGPRLTPRLPVVSWISRTYESSGALVRGGSLDAVCTHLYPAGWYEQGLARLYVNRGIGLNQAWPVRFNCPPEVACFTLEPE